MKKKAKAKASGINVWCSHDKIVSTKSLKPNPKNPNIHPDDQIELLAGVIKRLGWRQPITVSNLSGMIVKGHGRLAAARFLGATKVPVDYQDYATEAEEYADLVADNALAELSEMDSDLMKEIADLDIMKDFDLSTLGVEYPSVEITTFTDIEVSPEVAERLKAEAKQELREEVKKEVRAEIERDVRVELDGGFEPALDPLVGTKEVGPDDIDSARERLAEQMKKSNEKFQDGQVKVMCPHCAEEFYINE